MRSDIASIDLSAYERYAHDVSALTSFIEKMGPLLGERGSLQTAILNVVPQFSATTLLFQTQQKVRWARIMMPISYLMWHTFSPYDVPFLGENEVIDAFLRKIRGYAAQAASLPDEKEKDEDEREKDKREKGETEEEVEILIRLFEETKKNNEMVDHVIAIIHQFLHA